MRHHDAAPSLHEHHDIPTPTRGVPGKRALTARLPSRRADADRPAEAEPGAAPRRAAPLGDSEASALMDVALRPHEHVAPGAIPAPVRRGMEQSLGGDFSDVRLHSDGAAGELGARAFTRGRDIHFAPGELDLGSSDGLELLGHELAHVVQQDEGRASPTTALGKGIAIDDDELEREADARGAAAAAHTRAVVGAAEVPSVTPGASPRSRGVVQGKFTRDGKRLRRRAALKIIKKRLRGVPVGAETIAKSKTDDRDIDQYIEEHQSTYDDFDSDESDDESDTGPLRVVIADVENGLHNMRPSDSDSDSVDSDSVDLGSIGRGRSAFSRGWLNQARSRPQHDEMAHAYEHTRIRCDDVTLFQGTSRHDPTVEEAMRDAVFHFSRVPGQGRVRMTLDQITEVVRNLQLRFHQRNRDREDVHLQLTALEHMRVLALDRLAEKLGVRGGQRQQRASRRDNRQARRTLVNDTVSAIGDVSTSAVVVASNQLSTPSTYATSVAAGAAAALMELLLWLHQTWAGEVGTLGNGNGTLGNGTLGNGTLGNGTLGNATTGNSTAGLPEGDLLRHAPVSSGPSWGMIILIALPLLIGLLVQIVQWCMSWSSYRAPTPGDRGITASMDSRSQLLRLQAGQYEAAAEQERRRREKLLTTWSGGNRHLRRAIQSPPRSTPVNSGESDSGESDSGDSNVDTDSFGTDELVQQLLSLKEVEESVRREGGDRKDSSSSSSDSNTEELQSSQSGSGYAPPPSSNDGVLRIDRTAMRISLVASIDHGTSRSVPEEIKKASQPVFRRFEGKAVARTWEGKELIELELRDALEFADLERQLREALSDYLD